MAKLNPRGFTLIELILVMAISGMLMVIAFIGQRGLRARAQFDADVNRVVATLAQARTEATAGVNTSVAANAGMGANGCGGAPSTTTVFAGVAFTAYNALPVSSFRLDYYKADPGVRACVFDSRSVNVPSTVQVNVPVSRWMKILYVRTSTGGLVVCRLSNPPASPPANVEIPSFRGGACSGAGVFPYTLNLKDSDGHTSQIQIDDSGLAKRLN